MSIRVRDRYRTNPLIMSMVDTRYINQMVISLKYVKYIPGIYMVYDIWKMYIYTCDMLFEGIY